MRKYIIALFIGIGLLFASSIDKEIKEEKPMDPSLKAAYFAGGCFWGVNIA